jgi:hypothetical protein
MSNHDVDLLTTENIIIVNNVRVHSEKEENSDSFFSERYRRVNSNFSDFCGFFLAAFFCMIAAGILILFVSIYLWASSIHRIENFFFYSQSCQKCRKKERTFVFLLFEFYCCFLLQSLKSLFEHKFLKKKMFFLAKIMFKK